MSLFLPGRGPAIIVPGRFAAYDKSFGELVNGDAKKAYRAKVMFEKALADSFVEDEQRHGKGFRQKVQTQSEMKRRADILARWFRVMRGELGYSMSKCEVEIGNALRAELDGESYEPPEAGRLYGVMEGES